MNYSGFWVAGAMEGVFMFTAGGVHAEMCPLGHEKERAAHDNTAYMMVLRGGYG